ncbi:MAG: SoxR reducing system RseC family protein [Candidatus Thiodiazotropha sp.]
MLEETGTVVEVWDDSLQVETQSRSACSHCSSSGCTTSVVSKLFGIKRNRLQLENSLGAKPGDRVVIGIPDDLLVRASVWAYLLPLIFMLASTALGGVFGASEGFQSLLALGGLAVGFYIVRWTTRNLSSQRRFKPRLLRIAGVEMPNLVRS